MTDFPNLNMSIGEYYKLLMEGKRPTRQRTTKEELKQSTPQPIGLTRGQSTQVASGIPQRKEPTSFGSLARSQSEKTLPVKSHGQFGSAVRPEKSGGDRHHHRHLNKRKHKLKSKMKYVHESSTPSQTGGKDNSLEPEQRQLAGGNNQHGITQETFNLKPQLTSEGGAANLLDASQVESQISKLRHRDRQERLDKPRIKKQKDRPHIKTGRLRSDEEDLEGFNDHQKHYRRDDDSQRKAMILHQRFEMVEVHPLYAQGRFATNLNESTGDELTFYLVDNITEGEVNFTVQFSSQEEIKETSVDLARTLFASRVLSIDLNYLKNPKEICEKLRIKETFQEDRPILITQLVSSHQSSENPTFGALSSQKESITLLKIELTDDVNLTKDIIPLENSEEEYEDFIKSNAELYQREDLKEIVRQAKRLNEAYESYEQKTSKIVINKENLEEQLFTLVNYQTQDPVQQSSQGGLIVQNPSEDQNKKNFKQGVYLRAKLDQTYYKEHILFVKKLGGSKYNSKSLTSSSKEVRSEWLQLSKNRVYADISKGYVSLECLSCHDGSNRLKKRNLRFVSYRESMAQRQALRMIGNETLETFEDQNRKAELLRDSSARPADRCIGCNYQAQGYDHLRCSACNKVYHEQCILTQIKKPYYLNLGLREVNWRCHECIRCVNCLSTAGKSSVQQLLVCKCCNSGYHYECLDPNIKLSLPQIIPELNGGNRGGSSNSQHLNISEIEFNCERCVQCEQCGAREAGKNRLNRWSKDFKLCSICNKKRKKNQFCIICECFWPDNLLQDGANPSILNPELKDYLNQNVIDCGKCGKLVHYDCDRIFDDESVKKRFQQSRQAVHNDYNQSSSIFSSDIIQYHCQDCRCNLRTLIISQIIENLSKEDKFWIFQDPVEDLIANYTKIIKTPMCFSYIKEKLKQHQQGGNQYLIDPSSLRKDISLIFENAMKFNLPKHKVHKEASRLNEVCQAVLNSVWSQLVLNSERTIDENKHKEWLRLKRRIQLKTSLKEQGLKLLKFQDSSIEAKDRPEYKLKLEDIFDLSEHQPFQNLEQPMQDIAHHLNEEVKHFDNDYEDYDQEQAEYEDGDEQNGSSLERQTQKKAIKVVSKTGGSGMKKKDLRARKNIDYDDDKGVELLGKRTNTIAFAQEQGNSQYSSKKARFKQQQTQFASQFSFSSIGQIKGANLLQQAVHQQEKQNMQSQILESNNASALFPNAPGHSSADGAIQQQQSKNPYHEHQVAMMKFYQEIDDERCYYSNPARCSFDDPSLVFEEMCYLCGSFGLSKDFLSCTLCGESFHTYCLQLMPPRYFNVDNNESSQSSDITDEDQQAIIAKFQPYWKCLNCKFCDICSSATQEAFLLYCDVCDKAFHSFCWVPQLRLIPKCQWKCQECFKCKECGTGKFFDPEKHLKLGTNQLLDHIAQSCQNDFEFSQNFSLCYECGMNHHRKSFCKICQSSNNSTKDKQQNDHHEDSSNIITNRKSRNHNLNRKGQVNDQSEKMLKCVSCGYYSHMKCSRLLPPISENEVDNEEDPKEFKCLECLLTGKSINHLIRETCEHYENMHQILNRHKLLGHLCGQILTPYFPQAHLDKAPVFLRAFIDLHRDFFQSDSSILAWLSLLETGVTFVSPPEEESTATALIQDNDEILMQKKVAVEESKNDVNGWSNELEDKVMVCRDGKKEDQSEAERAQNKMFAHKEGFLPPKRNLYEALASEEGFHRFGQRKHFIDPFAPETQTMITIPLDENLEKEVDFAQLYIDYELKAIMNIKLKFFDWFEDMLKSLIEKAQRKKKKNAMKKQDDSQSFQHGNPDASNDNGILSSLALGVQDPPSASIATTDHHHHHHNDPNAICTEEDVLVDNPQKKLQCIMCKLKGELTITGRLIPFQVNQFVHVNCALWSTDVHEIAEGGYLINFFQIWTTRARFTRCTHCGEPGASLYCSSTRSRCMAAYHFPCAYRNKKMAFAPRGVKETICEICCKGSRGIHTGLPNEYANTKRRYQIAKNQQPYNMTHHMTSLTLQQQSQLVPASAIQINGGSTSAADIEKPLQIEKWRPFFFDMFNRVGNMTVLSLRKEINQIIEEYCTSSKNNQDSQKDLKDFSTVRIYWKHFDIKNCEEGKNSDENIEMKEESTLGNGIGGKAFYLFTNNQIKELAYNDLEALLPYVCFRVNEKVNLGLHYLCQNPDEIRLIAERRNLLSQDFLQAQVFWQKLIQHFTLERLKFSLNNIIFSMSEFSGKTKYPVSIWNRGAEGTKNKAFFLRAGEQVLHAQGIQSQAAIFADKEFARDGSIQGTASVFISGQVESGRVISFGNNGAAISGSFKRGGDIVSYGNGTQQLIRAGIPTTIDDIFRRMTKINQMGDHQNPMASVKRVNASKHMQYEAVLHNLGKKMFYKAPPANSALFEETGPSSAVANNSINTKQKQAQSGTATTKGLQKKVRQADTVGGGQGMLGGNDAAAVSKESDLPIAMKYRLSKTQPKRVEVGPSKIHRNGLFTLEDLAGGDIVIEYVGEKIRNKVADKREIVYEQKGIGDCYLFRLDKELIIDATFNGNKARYLNHSCDANCSAKIINVQQQKHIIISANRPIKSGEELTYNYNFDYEADKIECFCGAPGCLGRLN